jgi:transcriptional regulator with XRE-family HTH domain
MAESDLRAIFGENVKKYRTFKGLSQAKLAEILDISPNFISDIESGKRWVSSDTLVNLAKSFGVEEYELLKPPETPGSEIASFIQAYTEKAQKTASEAVVRSLDSLRKQYVV